MNKNDKEFIKGYNNERKRKTKFLDRNRCYIADRYYEKINNISISLKDRLFSIFIPSYRAKIKERIYKIREQAYIQACNELYYYDLKYNTKCINYLKYTHSFSCCLCCEFRAK